MGSRAFVGAVLVAVVVVTACRGGCGGKRAEVDRQAPHEGTAVRAREPERDASTDAVLDAATTCPACCTTARIDGLSATVKDLDAGRFEAARTRLRTIGGPVAYAYLAYLTGGRERAKWTAKAMARMPAFRAVPPGPLDVLRAAIDQMQMNCSDSGHGGYVGGRIAWCGIFTRDPGEATRAFERWYNSPGDQTAGDIKENCTESLLRKNAPGRATQILAAQRSIRGFGHVLSRTKGLAMFGTVAAALDEIMDAFLDPFGDHPDRVDFDKAVRNATRLDPAVPKRVRVYERKLAKAAPLMGEGICAMAKAHGQKRTHAECVGAALEAGRQALAVWLSDVVSYRTGATGDD